MMRNIEEINKEIEAEFIKITKSTFFNRKHKLLSCFEYLYKSFKDNPDANLKANVFLGEGSLSQSLKYRKATQKKADTYCNRINHECLKLYTNITNPKIIFWVKRVKEFNDEYQEKISVFRLDVKYDNKNYYDINSKKKKVKAIENDNILDLEKDFSLSEITQFLDKYLKQVENEHRYLDINFLGMMPFSKNAIELEEAYIKLKATEDIPLSEASHLTEHTEWLSGIPEKVVKEKKIIKRTPAPPVAVENILQNVLAEKDRSKSHIVILGPPGSGKTTLLKYLAHSVASGRAEEWGLSGFIPIYINLPEYAHSGNPDLLQYALTKATAGIVGDGQKEGLQKALEYIINECKNDTEGEGRTILLLDALDEVKDEKINIITTIKRLSSMYEKAIIVLTSRIANYYEATLPKFNHYLLEDFQINDINNFIRIWFRIFAKERNLEGSEKDWSDWAYNQSNYLIHQINSKPNLKRLASLPLYLSFMLYLGSDPETDIPETRSIIYRKYFDKLIINWQKKYGLPFSPDDLFEGFINICWIIHRALYGDIKNDTTINFVKKSIRSLTDANADQLIDFWIKSGVLLTVKTKHQAELLLPRHLSFLEYGFACKLADLWDKESTNKSVWKDLKKNLHNQHLYEPLLLFASIIENPDDFLDRVLRLRDDLFYNNLFFLCHAVNELKNKLPNKDTMERLLHRLLELWQSPDEFVYEIKEKILKCFGLLSAIQILIELFQSEKYWRIRLKIADIIASIEDQAAMAFLERYFNSDTHLLVQFPIEDHVNNRKLKQLISSIFVDLYEKEIDPEIRRRYIAPIGKLGDSTTVSLLHKLFKKEPDANPRGSLAKWIGILGDVNTIPDLEKLYNDENDPEVKYQLACSICQLGKKSTIPLLLKLNKKYIDIRQNLPHWINKLDRKTRMPFLEQLYNIETDPRLKRCIAQLIYQFGDDTTIPFLKKLFKEEVNSNIRKDIAFRIGIYGDRGFALSHLTELYEKDSDPNERRQIAISISRFDDGNLLKQLFKIENDLSVKRELIFWIGRYGDRGFALSHLTELYEKETDPNERRQIAISISRFDDGNLLKQLFKIENDLSVKRELIFLISQMGSNSAITILKKFYEDETDIAFKRRLALSIGKHSDKQTAVSFLKELFHEEADLVIKEYITNLIANLGCPRKAILLRKKLYRMRTHSSGRLGIAHAIHRIAKTGKVLVFEDKKDQWEIIEIPELYNFKYI